MVTKTSGPQKSFLIVTVICIVERRKKSMSPRFVEIDTYGYHGNVTWRLLLSIGSGSVESSPPPETLTRNVSSSLGSLTVTACPLIASFRVCSSLGDVELVDSKATDGLLRVLACPLLDIGARCFRLVWGDRWTLFTPLSWCSFDSESPELLFSNKKKLTKNHLHTRKTVGLRANQLL